MTDIRERFESHARASGVQEVALARWPSGEYVSPIIAAEYRGYCAALAAPAPGQEEIDSAAFSAAVAERCSLHAAASRTLSLIRSAAQSGADDAALGRACRAALLAAAPQSVAP